MSAAWNRFTQVALRKERVDRNDNYNLHCVEEVTSLSARRAWIEILGGY